MFNFRKKSGFPLGLFVAASLLALFLFVLLYLSFLAYTGYTDYGYDTKEPDKQSEDKYYLNKDFKQTDPFITRRPQLQDMLAGPIVSAEDPSYGDRSARVDLVIFSDYTCRFCAKQEQKVKNIAQEQSGVRVIRKDYPVRDTKSDSFRAAVAGRCAQAQSAFWDYHDRLYRENDYSRAKLVEYASDLGLNTDLFRECLSGSKARTLVEDNIAEANALDITGVPFLYVNDQEVMGDISQEDLKRIIQVELNR